MSKNILFLIISISIIFFNSIVSANGNTAFELLKINNNPINTALNHSNYTYTERNGNHYANPALLPKTPRYYLNLNYSILFKDYDMYAANFSYPLKYGFITAGLSTNEVPSAIMQKKLFNASDEFKNSLYYLSYGVNINQLLKSGITVKYVEEKINDDSLNKILFDIGLLFEIVKDAANIGLTVQNIGNSFFDSGVKKDIPVMHGIGLDFEAYNESDISLAFLFSLSKISDEKNFQSVGVIFGYKDIKLFTGYSTRNILNDKLNYGLSVKFGNANISVSRANYGNLGNYLTFNLSIEFGQIKKQSIQSLHKLKKTENIRCLNCAYEYLSDFNYCPRCGQAAATVIY